MTLFGDDDRTDAPAPSRQERRATRGWYVLVIGLVLTLALGVTPAPYVIERPGPVFNTLGTDQQLGTDSDEATPLISISGHETYPTEGSLDLLTVRTFGMPGDLPSWTEVAASWFSVRDSAIPVDVAYPPSVSVKEVTERSDQLMTQSQNTAVAAALDQLGIEFEQTITVVDTVPAGPVDGVLKAGDVLTKVNGDPVTSVDQLIDVLHASGAEASVSLTIKRDGETTTVTATPRSGDNGPELGVLLSTTFDFPFTVDIDLENVGGPSAGMMMALGIIDKLTPGALTGGEKIAGTGTITASGEVGPIGGIRQKMFGADDAGAQWFLAPADNCGEVRGHVPDGLTVFSVSTLDDSVAAVEAIASGQTDSVPTCRG